MMTLGANGCPALWGVPGPEAPVLAAPPKPPAPGCPLNDEPAPRALGAPACPGCAALPVALSPEGSGLLRPSVSWVWDDEGVACAEPEGELEAPCDGDDVPVASFFLEDLSVLALASCSCWAC